MDISKVNGFVGPCIHVNGNRILFDLPNVTGLSSVERDQFIDYIDENCKKMLVYPSELRFFCRILALFSSQVHFMGSGLEVVTRVEEEVCCITYYSLKGDFKYFETGNLDDESRKFVSRLHISVVECVLECWRERIYIVGILASRLNRWVARLQPFLMVSAVVTYFYGLATPQSLFLGLSLLPLLLILLLYILKRLILFVFSKRMIF